MRSPKQWAARIGNIRFPGSWITANGSAPGRLTLHCELSDAGKGAEGRTVNVIIPADQLETVERMVQQAIIARDIARRQAGSYRSIPTGGK